MNPPSKALRQLADLLAEIAACRSRMARQESALADLERRLHAELRPMEEKRLEIRVDTFRVLGKHLQAGWLNKRDRRTLESALLDLAKELEEGFGIDLEADRMRLLEDLPQEQEDENGAEEFPDKGSRSSFHRESDFASRKERSEDQKSPHRTAVAAEEAAAGDIRALYLLLARALHPDKETDAARREEKTAWMQRVISAYEVRDLAGLLDILGQDPLQAVGPYLSQAPLKTVQGFAKRLRRELLALKNQIEAQDAGLDPFLAGFLKEGNVDEAAVKRHLAEVRKEVKFMKGRRDMYRTTEGLQRLVEALRSHDWRELI